MPTAIIVGAAERVGRSRAIIATEPTASLIGGALLASAFGPRSVFLVLTAVALLAPLFALRIPPQREPARLVGPRFEKPGPMSIWSFSVGFTIDGIFIFGLGLLAAASFPTGAVLAAGLAMSLRYASEILFAPIGGMIGRCFGALRVLIVMSLATAVALLFLAGSGIWLWVGAVGTIVLRAIAGPLSAPVVAEIYSGDQRVSRVSTAGDMARHRRRHRAAGSGRDHPTAATSLNIWCRRAAPRCRDALAVTARSFERAEIKGTQLEIVRPTKAQHREAHSLAGSPVSRARSRLGR